ncbi:MAG: DUF3300 domain-containing protein [Acidobacteriota bacterium]
MRTLLVGVGAMVVFAAGGRALPDVSAAHDQSAAQTSKTTAAKPAPKPEELDQLLAPIALYPDPLLAQMLMAAADPGMVSALNAWLPKQTLKGTELQDAATKAGFGPSLVALVIFPEVVQKMAGQLDRTTRIGQAFAADRSAVFASIQRLRAKAKQMGTLKTNAQQEVQTQTTSSGEQVIVIEPANPQVVYVPQYNPTVVYTQPATTTVVVQEDNSGAAVAAGLIGFTAGIAIGAAMDNDYYYGPYGFYGGARMYNDAWDDYYDAREDARDDWMDHREDVIEGRGERRENVSEQRTERAGTAQEQRTQRTESRQENRPQSQSQRSTSAQAGTASAQASSASRTSQESRGKSANQAATKQRSGTSSDAFSNYSSGKSERAASSRGQQSRSSSSRSSGGRRR